ncbi:MAG: glycosyltransferase [Microscillaceae bacterium]|jgi:hypothetical protein|nr:glycosyltransferase [Microscillaceae bacterium]
MKLAPICLFVYKRLEWTAQTIEALKKNEFAQDTQVFVFGDGPRTEEDAPGVEEVRQYIRNLQGFKEINCVFQDKNIGLANSVIRGVSQVMNDFGKAIVVEDDLITTPNYLAYMNQALEYYQDNPQIFSIGGFTIDVNLPPNYAYDVYAFPRTTPWGWSSWKDRWDTIDWQVSDYQIFKNDPVRRRAFNQGGSDLANMLDRQMAKQMDSWAIRWNYQQFKNNQYTIFPISSKVRNIGFGKNATHTKFYNRYKSAMDESGKLDFKFQPKIVIEDSVMATYQNYYSLTTRVIGRLKHYLGIP